LGAPPIRMVLRGSWAMMMKSAEEGVEKRE
jgi:hypothetical protein